MRKNLKKLVLLHSNDMHGDFMAEKVDKNLIGGVSLLSGYVSRAREEEPNTLYCVAGDMFRGSIIDSEYLGISTIEIMNILSPDVVTVGNHEVDYGLAHLLFLEKCARFPIINANLHINTNGARLFEPLTVVELDGMKILFIGILTEEVLNLTKNEGLIGTFVDCYEAAAEIGRLCNAYNSLDIDLTVVLTHIGFEEDKKLAALLDPDWGVDIIIGGHSHTLPEKPAVVNGIPIVQAGTGTDQIGRFDILVDMDNNCVDSFEWKTVPINSQNCERDLVLEDLISNYKKSTDEKFGSIITRLARKLTHPDRYMETELGNMTADLLKESLGLDVMLVGSGSLRKTELGPIVTYQNFKEMYAYDDPIIMFRASGAQLKSMIKHMCRDETWTGQHTEFYQLSDGLEVTYDRATHSFTRFDYNGEPLDDDLMLTVGLQQYHFNNMPDSFGLEISEFEANGATRVVTTSINQVVEEYLTNNQLLNSQVYGRLVVVG